MRINRYLAKCSLGSRREVEDLITEGKIFVNQKLCKDLATDINVGIDVVTYENKVVTPSEKMLYLALNKPRGYIVTKSDEYKRQTIFDILPKFDVNLFSVGRLDKDSEGLLLLTNDGDFADKIMHPRYKLSKIYKVEVKGMIRNEDLRKLQEGMIIDGEKTLPARVFIKKSDANSTILRFTIYEGKNRQIRKMLETLGYKVISLKRLQIAGIKLDDLPTGMFRPLKPREIRSILEEEQPDKQKKRSGTRKTTLSSREAKEREYRKPSYTKERTEKSYPKSSEAKQGKRPDGYAPFSRERRDRDRIDNRRDDDRKANRKGRESYRDRDKSYTEKSSYRDKAGYQGKKGTFSDKRFKRDATTGDRNKPEMKDNKRRTTSGIRKRKV
ncbi:MAG: rRNA pseudouridine synthase [Candidatus Cloacimonetes bacterium]|nr:rRNA pseudouridine synthase [Candidatus Cloacimonadota bacterium]